MKPRTKVVEPVKAWAIFMKGTTNGIVKHGNGDMSLEIFEFKKEAMRTQSVRIWKENVVQVEIRQISKKGVRG